MSRPDDIGRAPPEWPSLPPEEQAAAFKHVKEAFEDLRRREQSWKRRQIIRKFYLNLLLIIPFLALLLVIGWLNIYAARTVTPSRESYFFAQLLSIAAFLSIAFGFNRLLKKRQWLRRLAFVKGVFYPRWLKQKLEKPL